MSVAPFGQRAQRRRVVRFMRLARQRAHHRTGEQLVELGKGAAQRRVAVAQPARSPKPCSYSTASSKLASPASRAGSIITT
jgi:hypothetical protein